MTTDNKKLSELDHANLKLLALVVERERMSIRAAETALTNAKLSLQIAEMRLDQYLAQVGMKYGVDVGVGIDWATGEFEEQHHEQHDNRRTHQSEIREAGQDRPVADEAPSLGGQVQRLGR